ncbi:hypothetical protein QN277_014389 [Acacia crassicarpa]|uniref:Uncharacterized protein n=1 Tax=Acacia crassicarpa TaxID=499986 RepID=A0AAE1IP21_9FABA|nr:hypothetical protein QN277_014389 [Acacia crassicarpa]
MFTNQDVAVTRALQEGMSMVKYALDTCYIAKNAMKRLPSSMVSDFNHYMYLCWNEVEFEKSWQNIIITIRCGKKLVVDVHVSNNREIGIMLYEELKDTCYETIFSDRHWSKTLFSD